MIKTNIFRSTAFACLLIVASGNCFSAIVITATETGGDVVLSGGGTADLTGLSYSTTFNHGVGVWPSINRLWMSSGTDSDVFDGLSGPIGFGTGGPLPPSSSSGDAFGLSGGTRIVLPDNYVSGAALSATMTFDSQTFASMGLTPGTYVWTWGAIGAGGDSFTLQIGDATIPEPAVITLMGLGLAGIGYQRRRKIKAM